MVFAAGALLLALYALRLLAGRRKSLELRFAQAE
jgi:hypothetical protein